MHHHHHHLCFVRRILANYLVWLLLMDLAPETTDALKQYENDYRRILQVGTLTPLCACSCYDSHSYFECRSDTFLHVFDRFPMDVDL